MWKPQRLLRSVQESSGCGTRPSDRRGSGRRLNFVPTNRRSRRNFVNNCSHAVLKLLRRVYYDASRRRRSRPSKKTPRKQVRRTYLCAVFKLTSNLLVLRACARAPRVNSWVVAAAAVRCHVERRENSLRCIFSLFAAGRRGDMAFKWRVKRCCEYLCVWQAGEADRLVLGAVERSRAAVELEH